MKFKGLIGDALGYIVIRGYAKIEDLKKYSTAKEYQRITLPQHIEEIKKFYHDGKNLFFPEIILSLELKFNFDKKSSYSSNLTQDILDGKNFNSNVDDIKIQLLKPRYQGDITKIANIIVPDNAMVFGRIDGNHRLEAFSASEHFDKEVPFCIVLLDQDRIQKQEKILFHNINSKVEPLKTEEVLSSIILDEENFSGDDLTSEFGESYTFSREYSQLNIRMIAPLVAKQLENFQTSAFEKIFTLLAEYKFINSPNNLEEVLRDIEFIYKKNKALYSNLNASICISLIFYAIYDSKKLIQFENWIIKNYFHEIPEITPERIVQIFENLTKNRKLKIFVAMPYWSHAHVNEYNKLFKEALKEIEQEENIFYELFPIMRHRGASQRIDQRLLKQIKDCDVFIADLTGINQNVLYEVAYSEGLDKPSLLLRTEEDDKEKQLPFDMAQRQYVPYPKGAYYSNIKSILKRHLPTIIDDYQLKKQKEI